MPKQREVEASCSNRKQSKSKPPRVNPARVHLLLLLRNRSKLSDLPSQKTNKTIDLCFFFKFPHVELMIFRFCGPLLPTHAPMFRAQQEKRADGAK